MESTVTCGIFVSSVSISPPRASIVVVCKYSDVVSRISSGLGLVFWLNLFLNISIGVGRYEN